MEQISDIFLSLAVQLFIIVDPVAGVPLFLAITPNNTREERRRMARRGCGAAFLVMMFFVLAGPPLLAYFGIETPAVRICGGILLFVIALEMLYGKTTGTGTSRREERLAGEKEDISITPLAIPLLAGPGAITTILLFTDKAEVPFGYLAILLATATIFAVTYLFLARADRISGWLGTLGMTIVTRIMGLILAFISVQYVLDGVRTVMKGQAG
jgi:multiple antibiotic resistance protein